MGDFFVAEGAAEGFVFDDDAFVDPVIEVESSEPLLLDVVEFEFVFFDAGESEGLEFVGEGALVVFFAESTGSVAVDAHGGSDDLVGEVRIWQRMHGGWAMGGVGFGGSGWFACFCNASSLSFSPVWYQTAQI